MAIINDADKALMYQGFADGACDEDIVTALGNKCSRKTVNYYRQKWKNNAGVIEDDIPAEVTEDDIPTEEVPPTQMSVAEDKPTEMSVAEDKPTEVDIAAEMIKLFITQGKRAGKTNAYITLTDNIGEPWKVQLPI